MTHQRWKQVAPEIAEARARLGVPPDPVCPNCHDADLAAIRRDAERWRKLLAETLREKTRIRVGMGGVWISGSYLEQQVDLLGS